jgi:phosphonate degradation associated HDIG domain protein
MALSVPDIVMLLTERGGAMYGSEAVTQLEHALQCAMLAERAGATPAVVVACLLHDLGHLLVEHPGVESELDVDDVHQYRAIPFLRPVFSAAVLEPIRLHVDAKRYLCFAESDYWDTLSPASRHSLELQGGSFTGAEAANFIAIPFARDAVDLRRWDDLAKIPGNATPPIAHYLDLLRAMAVPNSVVT